MTQDVNKDDKKKKKEESETSDSSLDEQLRIEAMKAAILKQETSRRKKLSKKF